MNQPTEYPCCGLLPLDQIRVRGKRSLDAKRLDGELAVVMEHQVSGKPIPGKHTILLLGGEVIWGDEYDQEGISRRSL